MSTLRDSSMSLGRDSRGSFSPRDVRSPRSPNTRNTGTQVSSPALIAAFPTAVAIRWAPCSVNNSGNYRVTWQTYGMTFQAETSQCHIVLQRLLPGEKVTVTVGCRAALKSDPVVFQCSGASAALSAAPSTDGPCASLGSLSPDVAWLALMGALGADYPDPTEVINTCTAITGKKISLGEAGKRAPSPPNNNSFQRNRSFNASLCTMDGLNGYVSFIGYTTLRGGAFSITQCKVSHNDDGKPSTLLPIGTEDSDTSTTLLILSARRNPLGGEDTKRVPATCIPTWASSPNTCLLFSGFGPAGALAVHTVERLLSEVSPFRDAALQERVHCCTFGTAPLQLFDGTNFHEDVATQLSHVFITVNLLQSRGNFSFLPASNPTASSVPIGTRVWLSADGKATECSTPGSDDAFVALGEDKVSNPKIVSESIIRLCLCVSHCVLRQSIPDTAAELAPRVESASCRAVGKDFELMLHGANLIFRPSCIITGLAFGYPVQMFIDTARMGMVIAHTPLAPIVVSRDHRKQGFDLLVETPFGRTTTHVAMDFSLWYPTPVHPSPPVEVQALTAEEVFKHCAACEPFVSSIAQQFLPQSTTARILTALEHLAELLQRTKATKIQQQSFVSRVFGSPGSKDKQPRAPTSGKTVTTIFDFLKTKPLPSPVELERNLSTIIDSAIAEMPWLASPHAYSHKLTEYCRLLSLQIPKTDVNVITLEALLHSHIVGLLEAENISVPNGSIVAPVLFDTFAGVIRQVLVATEDVAMVACSVWAIVLVYEARRFAMGKAFVTVVGPEGCGRSTLLKRLSEATLPPQIILKESPVEWVPFIATLAPTHIVLLCEAAEVGSHDSKAMVDRIRACMSPCCTFTVVVNKVDEALSLKKTPTTIQNNTASLDLDTDEIVMGCVNLRGAGGKAFVDAQVADEEVMKVFLSPNDVVATVKRRILSELRLRLTDTRQK